MIGTTLDKYAVLQKVGEGGMATVYRGRHATLDRDVAIKVLHPHLSSSSRMRKRFEREAQAIEHLRHENILEIFDYSGLDGSDCYIVTEFVEGDTLSSLLHRRGRLPSEVVALLGIALCKALAYAHASGVLHRDIKPDNVMVRVDGTVKLMDFGIARFLDETRVTMTGALVGSPAFMSPEQAREAPLDQRSDLFSLGTVLFDLVTGSLPFTGSNPSLILKNVIEGNRPNVSELAPTMSPTLGDIVERLMATDPEDRYNQASEVEEHLREVLREAKIDPSLPEWSLVRWLHDPDEVEGRLQAHLRNVLVSEGRRLLEANDHLAALRLLNRVLSMDEDNAEVLALVQTLHKEPKSASANTRGRWAGVGAAAFLLAGVAALLWMASGRERASDRAVVVAEPEPPAGAGVLASPEEPDPSERFSPPAPEPVVEAEPPPPSVPPPPPTAPAPGVVGAPAPRTSVNRVVRPPPDPAEDRPPERPVIDEPWATLRVNTQKNVADVYLGGKKVGSTREALLIPPGTHVLTLKSRLFEDQRVEVTASSGEERVVEVTLRPRPSKVTFAEAWADECAVSANGAAAGTLAALGRALPVQSPDRALEVVLTCPDGTVSRREWTTVPVPAVRFPGPP